MTNIQEPLIKYRIHNQSITANKRSDMRRVTEDICVAFQRKTLSNPTLRTDYFQQDCFTEFMKNKK